MGKRTGRVQQPALPSKRNESILMLNAHALITRKLSRKARLRRMSGFRISIS